MGIIRTKTKEMVERLSMPVPECGCWIWMGNEGPGGYGRVACAGKRIRAHRFSWEVYNGPIPEGVHVLHKCDTPLCVNPDHLFLGTIKDNSRDMHVKGRAPNKKGINHPMVKLTEKEVRSIRLSSLPYREISSEFGVALSAISRIKSGKRWGHVQ